MSPSIDHRARERRTSSLHRVAASDEKSRRGALHHGAGTTGRATSHVPLACLLVYVLGSIALAISPRNRTDWLLENSLAYLAVAVGVATFGRWRFSDRSYLQLTLFLILHAVGAHYTYSEVPLGGWLRDTLAWSRNHYDRLVHFAFGLLVLRPAGELALRGRDVGPIAAPTLSLTIIVALSVAYEVIEWLSAIVVDPAAGTAFLGTQGDVWDAQKDMSLAALGALVAASVEAIADRRSSRASGTRARRPA